MIDNRNRLGALIWAKSAVTPQHVFTARLHALTFLEQGQVELGRSPAATESLEQLLFAFRHLERIRCIVQDADKWRYACSRCSGPSDRYHALIDELPQELRVVFEPLKLFFALIGVIAVGIDELNWPNALRPS